MHLAAMRRARYSRSMSAYRVAVLRGGPSDEYDVSLETGAGVLEALAGGGYEPVDVIITRKGEWLRAGRSHTPQQILSAVDVVFIALHGAYGEDGTVQRLLDRSGIPYTGSDAFSSAIALNKVLTKNALRDQGVLMARHMLAERSMLGNMSGFVNSVRELLGTTYVVKPVSGGSSIGTRIVKSAPELESTLAQLLADHEQVLVEEYIAGKEATCGVVERFRDQALYALPAIEIVPPRDAAFFDYAVKYNGCTEEICPGRFSREEKEMLEQTARRVHELLGLAQYSRSDFIVAPSGMYFLEVNTLPGLTPESLMPRALGAVGCAYQEFVHHLVEDAVAGKGR